MANRYEKFLEGLDASGKRVPGFRYVKPGWNNFGTGIEMKRGLSAGLTLGALAFGAGMSYLYNSSTTGLIMTEREQRKQYAAKAEDVGMISRLSYDAVANAAGGTRDLGATGELVFGLNAARRGRQ